MIWTKEWPTEMDVPYFYRGSGLESDPCTTSIIVIPSGIAEKHKPNYDRVYTMRLRPPKLSSHTWVASKRYAHTMQGEFSSTPIPMPEE